MNHEEKLALRRQRYKERYAEKSKEYYLEHRSTIRQAQKQQYAATKQQLKTYHCKKGREWPVQKHQLQRMKCDERIHKSEAQATRHKESRKPVVLAQPLQIPDLSIVPLNLFESPPEPLRKPLDMFTPSWN
jgi:hypothetical protein